MRKDKAYKTKTMLFSFPQECSHIFEALITVLSEFLEISKSEVVRRGVICLYKEYADRIPDKYWEKYVGVKDALEKMVGGA